MSVALFASMSPALANDDFSRVVNDEQGQLIKELRSSQRKNLKSVWCDSVELKVRVPGNDEYNLFLPCVDITDKANGFSRAYISNGNEVIVLRIRGYRENDSTGAMYPLVRDNFVDEKLKAWVENDEVVDVVVFKGEPYKRKHTKSKYYR